MRKDHRTLRYSHIADTGVGKDGQVSSTVDNASEAHALLSTSDPAVLLAALRQPSRAWTTPQRTPTTPAALVCVVVGTPATACVR